MIYNSVSVTFNTPENRNVVLQEKEGYKHIRLPYIGSYWSGLSDMIDEEARREVDNLDWGTEDGDENNDWTVKFDYEELCKRIAKYTCEELLGLDSNEWEFIGVDMPQFYNYGDDDIYIYIKNEALENLAQDYNGDSEYNDPEYAPIFNKLRKEMTSWDGNSKDLDYSIEKRGLWSGFGGEIFARYYNDRGSEDIFELLDIDNMTLDHEQ